MPETTTITPPRVELVDPRTGLISREWYRYFQNQFNISGGAALTRVNDTNVTLTLGGSPLTALLNATSLTLGWTGTLGKARGGTAEDNSTGGTANTFWARPNGATGAATYRAILAADLPSLSATYVPVTRLINTTAPLTGGGDLSADRTIAIPAATTSVDGYLTAVDWTTFNNKGSVSSVALALPSIFTVSGSPVTTTGTLTGALATQAANLIFAGPTTGAAAIPTFRSQVAADIPDLSATYVAVSTIGTAVPSPTGTGASGTWGISITGTSAGAPPTGIAGGNLGGTYPNPSIASLPAISGALLTALTAANISAGTAAIVISGNAATVTNGVYTTRTISTTAPITGGGDLSVNRTFAIPAATTSVDGYLTAVDWTTFNNKGSGSVTSVALSLPISVFSISGSPITGAGTLTGTFATQTRNTVFAGPSSGGAVIPTFRELVSDDIPSLKAGILARSMTLPSTESITIPTDYQACVWGDYVINGTLTIIGELRVFN